MKCCVELIENSCASQLAVGGSICEMRATGERQVKREDGGNEAAGRRFSKLFQSLV